MKKLFAALLCLAIVLSLGGCGKKKKPTADDLLQGALGQAGDIYGDALGQVGDALGNIDGLTSNIDGLTGNIEGLTSNISGLIPNVDYNGVAGSGTGGGNTSSGGNHIHSFPSGNCEDPRPCECGAILEHAYLNGICVRCGSDDPAYVAVAYITLNSYSKSLFVGESFSIDADITPGNATNPKITWSSSDTRVATVSSSGKVTAKGTGNAVITATSASGVTASCNVTVKTDPLAGYILTTSEMPKEVSCYFDDTILYSCRLTSLTYTLEESNGYIGIKIVYSGTKTYDYSGVYNNRACNMHWKLYDSKGNVVKTGYITTPELTTRETFASNKATIIDKYDELPIDNYRLEFVDGNW